MKQFIVFILSTFVFTVITVNASEIPFEATDDEGTVKTGVVAKIDAEKIVLKSGETEETIPLERIVRLKNPGENPYRPRKAVTETPSAPPKKRDIASILDTKPDAEKIPVEDNAVAKNKIRPDTVSVVDLVDGSRLVATGLTLKGKTAEGRYLNEKEFSMPLDGIASIRLAVGDPSDIVTPSADWLRLAVPSDKGDRVVVGKPGSLDVYDGILTELGAETVSFTIDDETLPVPRRKVFGLVLHSAPDKTKAMAETVASLSLHDGGLLRLAALDTDDGGTLHWTTRQGISGDVDLEDVALIDFSRSNAVFLSELEPVRVEYSFIFERNETMPKEAVSKENRPDDNSPYSLLRSFRSNRVLSEMAIDHEKPPEGADPVLQSLRQRYSGRGGRENPIPERPIPGPTGVRLDGIAYENSLSIPARTVLEYTLPEPFKTFRGTAGIDDRLRPEGSARLVVTAGERLLGEILLRGDEPARKFSFDIPAGTVSLRIVVDFPEAAAGPATVGLGEAKLTK